MSDKVSLIYDADTGTILKHGPSKAIQAYMESNSMKAMQQHLSIREITFDASADAAEWINATLASSGSLLPRLKALLECSSAVTH